MTWNRSRIISINDTFFTSRLQGWMGEVRRNFIFLRELVEAREHRRYLKDILNCPIQGQRGRRDVGKIPHRIRKPLHPRTKLLQGFL